MPQATNNGDQRAQLLSIAERCEIEAENWIGQPMHAGLLDIARQLRERAALSAKVSSQ